MNSTKIVKSPNQNWRAALHGVQEVSFAKLSIQQEMALQRVDKCVLYKFI